MRRVPAALLVTVAAVVSGCTGDGGGTSGAALFSLHCASCHPNGGNTVNPLKTLRPADLRVNNIRTPADIVEKIRNPGAGMPRFTTAVIPDREAMRIAEYVLAGFR
jgi:cytochrome c6